MATVNLSNYQEEKPKFFLRVAWIIVNSTIFRYAIGLKLRIIRNNLLRLFGAKVPRGVMIYPSCKIFAPWNLQVGLYACIGPNTEIYNKDRIVIGANAVVSQGCFLCSASHKISSLMLPLVTAPITIGDNSWIAAEAFIAPGVHIGEGAVVGARAVVTKDVEPWTVVAGNPAQFVKQRVLDAT